jgi:hypothetical protein
MRRDPLIEGPMPLPCHVLLLWLGGESQGTWKWVPAMHWLGYTVRRGIRDTRLVYRAVMRPPCNSLCQRDSVLRSR